MYEYLYIIKKLRIVSNKALSFIHNDHTTPSRARTTLVYRAYKVEFDIHF